MYHVAVGAQPRSLSSPSRPPYARVFGSASAACLACAALAAVRATALLGSSDSGEGDSGEDGGELHDGSFKIWN